MGLSIFWYLVRQQAIIYVPSARCAARDNFTMLRVKVFKIARVITGVPHVLAEHINLQHRQRLQIVHARRVLLIVRFPITCPLDVGQQAILSAVRGRFVRPVLHTKQGQGRRPLIGTAQLAQIASRDTFVRLAATGLKTQFVLPGQHAAPRRTKAQLVRHFLIAFVPRAQFA